jgi:hypothetical protein
MEYTEMWNKCPRKNDLQNQKQIKLSTLQSYMDIINHIFTAYKRPLWVISIQVHLWKWIRCSKGASIIINMNKKKDNKPVNAPLPVLIHVLYKRQLVSIHQVFMGWKWQPILELNSLYLSNFVIIISRKCLFRWYWTIISCNIFVYVLPF